LFFFFSSRRRHTRSKRDWSSDVCSSDLRLLDRQHGEAIEETFGVQLTAPAVPFPRITLAQAKERLRESSHEPGTAAHDLDPAGRSEERRVGKECRAGRWRDE